MVTASIHLSPLAEGQNEWAAALDRGLELDLEGVQYSVQYTAFAEH